MQRSSGRVGASLLKVLVATSLETTWTVLIPELGWCGAGVSFLEGESSTCVCVCVCVMEGRNPLNPHARPDTVCRLAAWPRVA